MNGLVVALFAVLALTSASVIHQDLTAKILQGPSSKTTIVGPEGSVISSIVPGGRIITEEEPGLILNAAPVVSPVVSAPAVELRSGLALSTGSETIIAGPSGTIRTAAPEPSLISVSAPLETSVVSAPALVRSGPVPETVWVPAEAKSSIVSASPVLSSVSLLPSAVELRSGLVASGSLDTIVAGPSATLTAGAPTQILVSADAVPSWQLRSGGLVTSGLVNSGGLVASGLVASNLVASGLEETVVAGSSGWIKSAGPAQSLVSAPVLASGWAPAVW